MNGCLIHGDDLVHRTGLKAKQYFRRIVAALAVVFVPTCASLCPSAHASPLYAAVGYNFIPGSNYVALGFRSGMWGAEALVMSLGKEEPTTRSGPEGSLDVLAYVPHLPVFVRAGIVTGWAKQGLDIGAGVDLPLTRKIALRIQSIEFNATEDAGHSRESEHQFSVGILYHF